MQPLLKNHLWTSQTLSQYLPTLQQYSIERYKYKAERKFHVREGSISLAISLACLGALGESKSSSWKVQYPTRGWNNSSSQQRLKWLLAFAYSLLKSQIKFVFRVGSKPTFIRCFILHFFTRATITTQLMCWYIIRHIGKNTPIPGNNSLNGETLQCVGLTPSNNMIKIYICTCCEWRPIFT